MKFSVTGLNCGITVRAAVFVAFCTTLSLPAATITFESGSAVTYLNSGSTSADFAAAFTAADFTAAMTGTAASVLSSTGFYFAASNIPGAVWIGTNTSAGAGTGDTALYAISFTLPSVSAASLSLAYGVDNALGDRNAGLYINDTALPSSTGIPCGIGLACSGAFTTVQTYTDSSIGPLLVSGTNTLFLDGVNLGGPGGLIFSATVTYTPAGASAPEPSTLVLPVAALLILLGLARRRRSAA